MSQDLLLFAQLMVFLSGAVLYGFLAADLLRQPRAFASGPMRLLVVCLGFWYAGCFVAALADILLPPMLVPERFVSAFGLARGFAWLLGFPLLVHAAWSLSEPRPSRLWLAPAYLSVALFVPAAARAWQGHGIRLSVTALHVYPLLVAHVALAGALTAWLLGAALRRARDLRQTRFLRWLLGGVAGMVALIAGGAAVQPAAIGMPAGAPVPAAGAALWGEAVWRLSAEASTLVLGIAFLTFVQRYGLLRLSLSRRGVRRLLYVIGAMALLVLAGPAVGIAGTAASRRLVAGGLLVALAAALVASPVEWLARRRFPALRRLLGQAVRAEEIEELTRGLRSWTLSEAELLGMAAAELTRWLGVGARFLPAPAGAGGRAAEAGGRAAEAGGRAAEAGLWRHFAHAEARAVNRLDEPSVRVATLLDEADLQAAFPLRVAGSLHGVLGLEIGDAAAGYEEGEREAVQVVLNQLAAVLEVRRLVAAQLAAARRLAEHERLSLLGQVTASLAHELKNPLAAMKALAQTMLEECESAEPGGEQVRDLRLIVDQIDRMHEVAREMLSFVRKAPEGGLAGAEPAGGVALTAMVRSTLYVLRHLARQRGVVIEADEVAEVGSVRGTAAAWQTVLFNLSLNAVQNAPASSKVRVGLCREGELPPPDGAAAAGPRVAFWIENAGPAVDPAVARRFALAGEPGLLLMGAVGANDGAEGAEAAEGAGAAAARKATGAAEATEATAPLPFAAREEGSGLGLALVAQRVRELAGEVALDSSPERVVFRVRVPDLHGQAG